MLFFTCHSDVKPQLNHRLEEEMNRIITALVLSMATLCAHAAEVTVAGDVFLKSDHTFSRIGVTLNKHPVVQGSLTVSHPDSGFFGKVWGSAGLTTGCNRGSPCELDPFILGWARDLGHVTLEANLGRIMIFPGRDVSNLFLEARGTAWKSGHHQFGWYANVETLKFDSLTYRTSDTVYAAGGNYRGEYGRYALTLRLGAAYDAGILGGERGFIPGGELAVETKLGRTSTLVMPWLQLTTPLVSDRGTHLSYGAGFRKPF